MPNINQLSTLSSIQGVSQETLKNNKVDGSEFLALLNELKSKDTSKSDLIDSSYALKSNISSLNGSSFVGSTESFLANSQANKSKNFIYDAIDSVNLAQLKADRSTAAFAAGYGDELQDALDVSKAEKYLQFFSEVRVKLVNAIKELSRTQI